MNALSSVQDWGLYVYVRGHKKITYILPPELDSADRAQHISDIILLRRVKRFLPWTVLATIGMAIFGKAIDNVGLVIASAALLCIIVFSALIFVGDEFLPMKQATVPDSDSLYMDMFARLYKLPLDEEDHSSLVALHSLAWVSYGIPHVTSSDGWKKLLVELHEKSISERVDPS